MPQPRAGVLASSHVSVASAGGNLVFRLYDIYQANTHLSCAPDQHILVLHIDAVGEGTLKWQE